MQFGSLPEDSALHVFNGLTLMAYKHAAAIVPTAKYQAAVKDTTARANSLIVAIGALIW